MGSTRRTCRDVTSQVEFWAERSKRATFLCVELYTSRNARCSNNLGRILFTFSYAFNTAACYDSDISDVNVPLVQRAVA